MEYTTLGQTGVTVSRLCFGTMTFTREADNGASARMFRRCLDAGISFFDCANVYSRGRAEELLGKLLSGRREKLVITSKAGYAMGEGPNVCRTGTGLSFTLSRRWKKARGDGEGRGLPASTSPLTQRGTPHGRRRR